MPRKARIDAFGALHSITVRGFEGRDIFLESADCDPFLERMGEILTETGTACFAWALTSNHAHLLLRTGDTPIAMVMRRVLTGYAVTYNRRHHRHGPVFLDRYRSVLCEEDPYLLEMVRHIHLAPLRAGVVEDLRRLKDYAYAGHGALLGKTAPAWQDVDTVLARFSERQDAARKAYRRYIESGVRQGLRSELADGSLVRSLGGWEQVKHRRGHGAVPRGDERILGGPEFVRKVLDAAEERLHPRTELALRGLDLNRLAERAAGAFGVSPEEIFSPVKVRKTVYARSVFCYWAVRKLGYTATDLAQRIGLTQPAVSISVQRGEALARERKLEILDREK